MNITRSFINFLNYSKKTMLLMIIVAIASVAITTTIAIELNKNSNLTVPSLGTIRTIGVEVYSSQNMENKITTINWNEIWLGTSKNITVYVRSISNYRVTLNLRAEDWTPATLSDHMTLSWDYNGTALNPDEIIQVTLTLSIEYSPSLVNYLIANDTENFNVDIHIIAS